MAGRIHAAYADVCHGGRYRVDIERADKIPDYFSLEEKAAVAERAMRLYDASPSACSAVASNNMMGRDADALNHEMDLFDRLEAEYLVSSGEPAV